MESFISSARSSEAEDSIELNLFGRPCLCLGLERLIEVKRAAGRPKDFEAIAELEALRDELGSGD